MILILFIFLSFLKLLKEKQAKYALFCGLGIFLLLTVQPYEVLTVLLILLLYLGYLIAAKKIAIDISCAKFLLIIFLLSLPAVIYNYYAVTHSPALNFWVKSAAVLSFHPITYLIGLGLLGLFSLAAIYKTVKEKSSNFYFLIFWIIVGFFLAYQPWIHFQRRFLVGIVIAFSVLAAEGIFIFLRYLKKYFSRATAEGLILWIITFMTFSNIVIIQKDVEYYKMRSWPFYLEREYLNAFDWIKNNAGKSDIVLTIWLILFQE